MLRGAQITRLLNRFGHLMAVLIGLEHFVWHLYGVKTETRVDEARVLLARKKAGTESGELDGRCNIGVLPPCQSVGELITRQTFGG